jgi:hypothetical protein
MNLMSHRAMIVLRDHNYIVSQSIVHELDRHVTS